MVTSIVGAQVQLSRYAMIFEFPVTMAEGPHPIPSRTRKLSPPAPMVLHGKTVWESRTSPGFFIKAPGRKIGGFFYGL